MVLEPDNSSKQPNDCLIYKHNLSVFSYIPTHLIHLRNTTKPHSQTPINQTNPQTLKPPVLNIDHPQHPLSESKTQPFGQATLVTEP